MPILELATLFLVVLVVVPSLAHALEMPGKMRLKREQYLAVQPIYYPGFTFTGAAEPLSVIALALLAYFRPAESAPFMLIIVALFAMMCVNAVYWTITHPVNSFWLKETELAGAGKSFFDAGGKADESADWEAMRDRWEYSHLVRAVFAVAAFVSLAIALVIY